MSYRHYSFDVWLTLIRSNPAFRQARTAYFADLFNPDGLPVTEVDARIREVDLTCTRVNELVGRNIDSLELVLLMAHRLGVNLAQVTQKQLSRVEQELGELFTTYPPRLTDEQLPEVLTALHARGATLSVLSNTGLIRGTLLRQFWAQMGLGALFSFQLYSDEVSLSKPNPAFYALLSQQASQLANHRQKPLQLTQIIHIGDNPLADQAGAVAAGLQAALIDPNQPNFFNLLHD